MQSFIVALITWACCAIAPHTPTKSIEEVSPKEEIVSQSTTATDSLQVYQF